MKIAIIVDGNNKLGMGHVYQSITLKGLLSKKANATIFFLTKSDKKIITLLKSTNCPVHFCKDDNSIFKFLEKENPDRIIFDKLNVAPALAKKIAERLNAKLTIFTNLTKANQYADITVMAGMGSNFKNIYSKNKTSGQVQFWGPKYWLLRPEFYSFKKKTKDISKPVKNIMLLFGGADQANLSSRVLNEILKINSAFTVLLVLGAAFDHRKELALVLKNNSKSTSKVTIANGITNVAETMRKNDLIFVSPGLSFFEALSVSTPVLCFHQNKFQKDAWNGHIKTYDKKEVGLIPKLIKNKSFIFPSDKDIMAMQIGKGADEILKEILNYNLKNG